MATPTDTNVTTTEVMPVYKVASKARATSFTSRSAVALLLFATLCTATAAKPEPLGEIEAMKECHECNGSGQTGFFRPEDCRWCEGKNYAQGSRQKVDISAVRKENGDVEYFLFKRKKTSSKEPKPDYFTVSQVLGYTWFKDYSSDLEALKVGDRVEVLYKTHLYKWRDIDHVWVDAIYKGIDTKDSNYINVTYCRNETQPYDNVHTMKYTKHITRKGRKDRCERNSVRRITSRPWLCLRLSGYGWAQKICGGMSNRWVKVDTSSEFLNFLLTEKGALKESWLTKRRRLVNRSKAHTIDLDALSEEITVSGAGDKKVNGRYRRSFSSKPFCCFICAGFEPSAKPVPKQWYKHVNNVHYIRYCPSTDEWRCCAKQGFFGTLFASKADIRYSVKTESTVPPIRGWSRVYGAEPIPKLVLQPDRR